MAFFANRLPFLFFLESDLSLLIEGKDSIITLYDQATIDLLSLEIQLIHCDLKLYRHGGLLSIDEEEMGFVVESFGCRVNFPHGMS